MMELVLLRHAHALSEARSDFERPLSVRGEHDAAQVGALLAREFGSFDAVVASSARRTRRTAELVCNALAYPLERISFEDSAYEASTGTLLALLQALPDTCRRALLVAHNPGISRLGALLLQRGGIELEPAQFLPLQVDIAEWSALAPGCARLHAGMSR